MERRQKKYEALVHALHRDVYRYAYWVCQDEQTAQDVVQETYLRAWKAIDSLKDEKSAKSWLFTIVRRENARRFERKRLDTTDIDAQPVADPKHTGVEQEMENELLRRQIGQLSAEYREPLVLQVLGGFSGDEIASILQLNKNTVMTRLFRARSQLKESLDQSPQTRGRSNG
ncbi:sigma-70 family RNA polymerase sigma factor [Dongshaea marina]|uniref:sigma-70 family RNA polymerase sigma factor n=1 Tax=Dongshaea marina TaxID=2047966 RepID=UPI001F2F33C3|nr:sigma-70 family RNA polymerase sigma factor [Dongshaea marina]